MTNLVYCSIPSGGAESNRNVTLVLTKSSKLMFTLLVGVSNHYRSIIHSHYSSITALSAPVLFQINVWKRHPFKFLLSLRSNVTHVLSCWENSYFWTWLQFIRIYYLRSTTFILSYQTCFGVATIRSPNMITWPTLWSNANKHFHNRMCTAEPLESNGCTIPFPSHSLSPSFLLSWRENLIARNFCCNFWFLIKILNI